MNQPCLFMLLNFFIPSNFSVTVSPFFPVLSPQEGLLHSHLHIPAINRWLLRLLYLFSACLAHLYWKGRTCVCIQKVGDKQNMNIRFLSYSQCCLMLASLRSNVQMMPCRHHSWPWKPPLLFSSSFWLCCGLFPDWAICATWEHLCFN